MTSNYRINTENSKGRGTRDPSLTGPGREITRVSRLFLILGAFSAAISVAAGAFGAHALRARVEPRLLEVFETAARYQMYHALALIAVALVLARTGGITAAVLGPAPGHGLVVASGWCFAVGTVLFSGSLYAMTFSGVRALGAITPLGGIAFIAGWICLAVAAVRAA